MEHAPGPSYSGPPHSLERLERPVVSPSAVPHSRHARDTFMSSLSSTTTSQESSHYPSPYEHAQRPLVPAHAGSLQSPRAMSSPMGSRLSIASLVGPHDTLPPSSGEGAGVSVSPIGGYAQQRGAEQGSRDSHGPPDLPPQLSEGFSSSRPRSRARSRGYVGYGSERT